MTTYADLPAPLRKLVTGFEALLEQNAAEPVVVAQGGALLRTLLATDDWLPDAAAQPDPQYYRQYLLYRDPQARFSVVSFVWGPGQSTPIHDHTVWGLIGLLRGAGNQAPHSVRGHKLGFGGSVERDELGRVRRHGLPSVGVIERDLGG